MRLIGTVDGKVDAKGRVFLPAIFRRALGDKESASLVMRKDIFENCLVLYTESEWYEHLDELQQRLNRWNREHRALFRRYVSDVEWLTLDAGGRFLIPRRSLQMAGIRQEVTFVGMDRTIEIWAKRDKSENDDNQGFGDKLQELMA